MSQAPESTQDQSQGGSTPTTTKWWRSLQAESTRRALLLTALGGLLIAGVLTALPQADRVGNRTANAISLGPRGNDTFDHAQSGDCLNWPDRTPDAAEIVDCSEEHRFEVAASVDMRTFPGSEYGPDAAPPSAARIQQISQEQCSAAVQRYLGDRFDPNSRFTVSMLWSGDKAWKQSGERRMLCGLQLPGANNQQLAFIGKVADIDQSKVWPAGTCLGIDPGHQSAHRHPGRLRGAARDGGHRRGEPRREVPGRTSARARAGHVHQGRVHSHDGCLPRSDPAAKHHTDADLQHCFAAELGRRQPSGVVQHRLDAGQRWLVDATQQRQGPADDQRPATGTAAGHSRRASQSAADPDAGLPTQFVDVDRVVGVLWVITVVGVLWVVRVVHQRQPERPDAAHAAAGAGQRSRADRSLTTGSGARRGADRREHLPQRPSATTARPTGGLAATGSAATATATGSAATTTAARPAAATARSATAGNVARGRADDPAAVR